MVGEVLEWRRCGPFLTLKNQWNEGTQQYESRCDFRAIQSGNVTDPVTDCAIADLIVVLNVAEKTMLRQRTCRPPMDAIAISGVDSVVDKGLRRAPWPVARASQSLS